MHTAVLWALWLLPVLRHIAAERSDDLRIDLELEEAAAQDGELVSAAELAASAVHQEAAALALKSHLLDRLATTAQQQVGVPGLGAAADIAKYLAIFTVIGVAFKALLSLCASRRCDCRRFKCIAQALLAWGWDEFEGFEVLLSVHAVQDVQNDGLFGKKEFKVKASFNWSNTETAGTKDMRWEQTKKLEIPQGAAEGTLSLFSLGTLKDSKIASYSMDTKRDMLDKGDSFFGKKQKLKLESKGKTVGTLLVTFRRKGEGGLGTCPIEGVDDDSALVIDVQKAIEEMVKRKIMLPLKPEEKLTGERKLAVLAKTLEGDLREIALEDGKDKGKVYIRVIKCNFAELKGDDMKEEWKKQLDKAAKKGLKEPQKKWYFAWYSSKNSALDAQKWHDPEGFFPLATMTSVHRSPERQDQFVLKYSAGTKENLVFRREQGKALDSWVEALDLAQQEIRESMKNEQETADIAEKEKAQVKVMHQQWVQKNGMPSGEEQWTAWFQWMKSANLSDETIKTFYQELVNPTQATQATAPKAKAKK